MDFSKYIRDDINFKILSNFDMPFSEKEVDFSKFKDKLKNYDLGIWSKDIMLRDGDNFSKIEIYNNKGEKINWKNIVLNYLDALNSIMREQIGVCIEKNIPRILDNKLVYLIIQRKNRADFDENFFIAFDKKVYFPMISKEYNLFLALIKLVELKKRAGQEIKIYDKIL